MPHHRHRSASKEAVVIGGVSVEAIGLNLYGPIPVSAGAEQAAINNRTGLKTGATGYFPTHFYPLSAPLGWRDPGPKNHRICIGITRGHTMDKTDLGSGHGSTG